MTQLGFKMNKPQPTSSQQNGVGCLTVLGLIFIVLKLTGNIEWSWWLVLSPFLFQIAVVAICLLLIVVVGILGRGR